MGRTGLPQPRPTWHDHRVVRTEITRLRELAVTERAALDSLLDTARVGHVGLVDDGYPLVIPTAIAREGDRVLVHGSTGSRWMRALALGAPACLTVTALDGLLVARSTFESSLHYRSAVMFGKFRQLAGDEKLGALDRLVEALLPGRSVEVRASTERELAATLVLAMPIDRWSLKVSDGWPDDGPEDVAGPAWAGVVPLVLSAGEPRPAPDLPPDTPVPPSVAGLTGR
jgi:nitroimidazol reductase NimA-like FMN-containing flavoprotein (pyridoxamine 5'-phosphate oxidase superfamily)